MVLKSDQGSDLELDRLYIENGQLRAINADLLTVCKALVEEYAFVVEPLTSETIERARSVIVKAESSPAPKEE